MALIVEAIPLKARLFFTLRELARFFWLLPGRWRYRHRLARAILSATSRKPLVNYGKLNPPPQDHLPIGGEVKLFHLQERFPEKFEKFNLVYLVSSALPRHAIDFVRHARARGARLVWNQNGVAYKAWCGNFYPWFNLDMAALRQEADYVINQSNFCRACADRYLGKVSSPSETLFNPVNLDQYRPRESRPAGPMHLLAMGTSHHFYRVRASIDCLAELRKRGENARLTIAGGFRWAGAEDQVAAYVRALDLGDFIHLLPPFTQSEAPAIYQQADLLLHPKYKDPCPTVIVEALASGLPVIASASGGLPEMVPSTCGRLLSVPDNWEEDHPPDPKKMADAAQQLMGERPVFSEAARAHAEVAFDRNRWVQRHAEIFEGLLK